MDDCMVSSGIVRQAGRLCDELPRRSRGEQASKGRVARRLASPVTFPVLYLR